MKASDRFAGWCMAVGFAGLAALLVCTAGVSSGAPTRTDTGGRKSGRGEGKTQAERHRETLPADGREYFRRTIRQYTPMFREYQEGKRDHADARFILWHLTKAYWMLSATGTGEGKEVEEAWEKLLEEHPEYRGEGPGELSESRDMRAKNEARQKRIAALAENFVPSDCHARYYWSERHVAAVYQRRVEFFQMPEGVRCYTLGGHSDPDRPIEKLACGFASSPLVFKRDGVAFHLAPHKTIRFSKRIRASRISVPEAIWDGPCRVFGLCTDEANPYMYTYCNDYEIEVMTYIARKRGKDMFEWRGPKGDYDDFYGVFSVSGEILAEIPFRARLPDRALETLYADPGGKFAIFAVGKRIRSKHFPDLHNISETYEVIVWTPPKGIERMSVQEVLERHPFLKGCFGLNLPSTAGQ